MVSPMTSGTTRKEKIENTRETTPTQLAKSPVTYCTARDEQVRRAGEAKGAQLGVTARTDGTTR